MTPDYSGPQLATRVDGRRMLTPLVIVIAAIGVANVVFALDSIPAIFGLTQDPYIVLTANAFALMGLRQLYFLIGGLLERIIYLNVGLSVILGFIGVKLVIEALHGSHIDHLGADPAARDRHRDVAAVHPRDADGHRRREPGEDPAGRPPALALSGAQPAGGGSSAGPRRRRRRRRRPARGRRRRAPARSRSTEFQP